MPVTMRRRSPWECGDGSPLWGPRRVAALEGGVVPPHSKGFAMISTARAELQGKDASNAGKVPVCPGISRQG